MRGAGPTQAARWLRRVARALRGAGCVLLVPVRLAAPLRWRLTGFEVSVGVFALESSADEVVDLLARGTSVVDA